MKRKQHYVPQFYLKQFADEKGKIYAYDYNEKKLIHVLPKNICAKRFLYETQWKNANENLGKFVFENVIENIFQEYEGEFSALIKKLIKCAQTYKIKTICFSIQMK